MSGVDRARTNGSTVPLGREYSLPQMQAVNDLPKLMPPRTRLGMAMRLGPMNMPPLCGSECVISGRATFAATRDWTFSQPAEQAEA
jgi:hypothetical protein